MGVERGVDTSTVVIKVENDDKLRGLQVNHLISIQSSRVGQHLIGLVSKIIRKSAYSDSTTDMGSHPAGGPAVHHQGRHVRGRRGAGSGNRSSGH